MTILLRQLVLIIGLSTLTLNALAAPNMPSPMEKRAVAVHYTDIAYAIIHLFLI